MVFKDGKPVDRIYTFHSVPYLLKELGPYLVTEKNKYNYTYTSGMPNEGFSLRSVFFMEGKKMESR